MGKVNFNPEILAAAFLLVFGLSGAAAAQVEPKAATEATKKANAAVLNRLHFADKQDFEDANRAFIATVPELEVKDDKGNVVWTLAPYKFLEAEEAADTVNPSLWRQSRLNMTNGLFKVTDRVYQIRGFDLSNMTIIEGDNGLIVIDPLVSPETAKAGLDLYYQHRPKKPVAAVIYTHSHVDHYGGVKGVTTQDDVSAGKVAVIAPDGFLEEAASENVYAGTAMGRRALYHTGAILPKGARGQVDIHIPGVATPDVVQAMTPDMLLDYMGIRLSSEKADGKVSNIIWKAPGTGESYALELQNSVLIYTKGKTLANPDATLSMSRSEFADVLMGGKTIDEALASEDVTIEGNKENVSALFGMLDDFPLMFNIVTP